MKSNDEFRFLSLRHYTDRIGGRTSYIDNRKVRYERYLSVDDLVSESCVRIIECMVNYNPEKGKISQFIAMNVASTIYREAREQLGLVRIPVHTLNSAMKYFNAKNRNGRPLNKSEIITRIANDMTRGKSGEKLEAARLVYLAMSGKYLSLDEPSPHYEIGNSPSDEKLESKIKDIDGISPEDEAILQQLREKIRRVFISLTLREEDVLKLRFFKEKTMADIGKEFYVQKERVRQIEARALRKLRHPSRSKFLKEFIR